MKAYEYASDLAKRQEDEYLKALEVIKKLHTDGGENLLEKYNPYHDEKGRFASAGGAHTVVPKDGGAYSTVLAARAHGNDKLGYFTPHDTEESIRARAELENILLTKKSTHLINTPERQRLRERKAEELFQNSAKYAGGEVAQNRQVFVVVGAPAAGKSSSMAEPLALKHRARLIDSDDAKKLLPEYNGGKGAGVVHEESSDIAIMARTKAAARGDNLVLPIVGKSQKSVEQVRDQFKAHGYDVHLVLVDVSPDNATQRAIARWQKTGRYVDTKYVYSGVGTKPTEVYEKVKHSFSSYTRYDNNVSYGVKPILVESSRKN